MVRSNHYDDLDMRMANGPNRDERKKQVTQSMAARQAKRSDNIAQRNERRKNHGAKPGKGKQRAGFEGSSRSVKVAKGGKGKGKK